MLRARLVWLMGGLYLLRLGGGLGLAGVWVSGGVRGVGAVGWGFEVVVIRGVYILRNWPTGFNSLSGLTSS